VAPGTGAQGRGFAVVATEVRNLASRSAAAAKEIKTLIRDSGEKVRVGAELVNESGVTLTEIVTAVKRVGDIVAEIAAASAEQAAGIDQVIARRNRVGIGGISAGDGVECFAALDPAAGLGHTVRAKHHLPGGPMILDALANAERYLALNPGFARAFAFLRAVSSDMKISPRKRAWPNSSLSILKLSTSVGASSPLYCLFNFLIDRSPRKTISSSALFSFLMSATTSAANLPTNAPLTRYDLWQFVTMMFSMRRRRRYFVPSFLNMELSVNDFGVSLILTIDAFSVSISFSPHATGFGMT
jgi:hypothetical protein